MPLPIISGYRELEPAPRRFLLYIAINVVSWQNIIGPATVLFARKIEMPESLVGMMLSFLPLSTLLLLFTTPIIVRLGPKRVMMTAWFLRNIIVCIVFFMPLALATGDKRLAWAVLLIAIFGFCIMRAVGAGGWLPWLHEIVPTRKRSIYFGTEVAVVQTINVAVLFTQARLLAVDNPGISRFLLIFAIGISMGFISLLWMRRIPGGAGTKAVDSFNGLKALSQAATDKQYMAFMMVMALSKSGIMWFGAAHVMFLRDVLAVRDSTTMTLSALGALGVLLTVGSWARFTEKSGSGISMTKTLSAHALAPFIFLTAGMSSSNIIFWAMLSVATACIFNAAFHVAATRAMLSYVPDHDRVGYTALWTICTALALGATPLAAGFIIALGGLWGFRVCFILSIVTTLTGAALCRRYIHERGASESGLAYLLNPILPLRATGLILTITMGLHESNRNASDSDT